MTNGADDLISRLLAKSLSHSYSDALFRLHLMAQLGIDECQKD